MKIGQWFKASQSGVAAWIVSSTVIFTFAVPFMLFLCLETLSHSRHISDDDLASAATGNDSAAPVAVPWYQNFKSKQYRMLERVATLSAVASLGAFGAGVSLALRARRFTGAFVVPSPAEVAGTLMLGAAFALVLCLLFIGGFIRGTLFPDEDRANQWFEVIYSLEEFAKLLIWSFLAGFSERIVPDYLSNLIARFRGEGPKNEKVRTHAMSSD